MLMPRAPRLTQFKKERKHGTLSLTHESRWGELAFLVSACLNVLLLAYCRKTRKAATQEAEKKSTDIIVEDLKICKPAEDDEMLHLLQSKKIQPHNLEKLMSNESAVHVRRKYVGQLLDCSLDSLPMYGYDYSKVMGVCCENVIGYMPIPVGVAGPIIINGLTFHVPMATTEGCLVASTCRGAKALSLGGGVTALLYKDGMTRG